MKISEQPTNHILVKADCSGDWEICNFAILTLSKEWAERTQKWIEATRCHDTDNNYLSSKFFDISVSFHVDSEGDETDSVLAPDQDWAYVDLEEGEKNELLPTESRLECYMLVLDKHGNGYYQAYGKHSGERFYTHDLPLGEIIEAMR
jgi:hypothetical protein